jgi:hypothetical protein
VADATAIRTKDDNAMITDDTTSTTRQPLTAQKGNFE